MSVAAPVSYSYDPDSFSDLYKEANGIRPGAAYFEWLEAATPAELQAEWDHLCRWADETARICREHEADALVRLDEELAKTCADHKVNVATAIRWMHDAYGTGGDHQFLDYYLGVAYGTIEKKLGLQPRNI